MMRLSFLVLLVFCGACATTSASAGSVATAAAPAVLTDPYGNVERTVDLAATATVAAKPADVVRALAAAYESLGIAADLVDSAQQLVARGKATVSRNLGGERLSVLFDCGQGQFGPRADDGRVTFSVASRVAGTAAPVNLTTRVEASVMPNDGAASGRIRCGSRGVLEERIRRHVYTQLGLPDPAR